MEDNIFMTDDFNDDVSNYAYQPDAITSAKSQPSSFWDSIDEYLTKPGEPRPFSGTNVGLGVAIGAPLAVASGVGVPLALGASALSSATGEYMRSRGSSEGSALAGEMISGGLPALGKLAVPVVKAFRYGAGRLLETPTKTAEDKALLIAKQKMFGPDTFKVLSTTENSDATKAALAKEFNLPDIGADEKVSSVLRKNLYEEIKGLTTKADYKVTPSKAGLVPYGTRAGDTIEMTTTPTYFSKSPEFKELLDDLQALKQRDRLSNKEFSSLMRIVSNDTSTNPKVAPEATKDLINLIQNGGTFVREGVEQKRISEEAQKALRERFNNYLERNLGEEKYNVLKQAEKQEFIAEARDAIPTLLDNKFKLPKDDVDRIASLVSQTPEGKLDFVNAFNQHLKSFDNFDQMKNEFIRLRPMIEKAGVLKREELVGISDKINKLPKAVKKERLKEMAYSLIMAPIAGTVGSETGQQVKKLNPFGAYTL